MRRPRSRCPFETTDRPRGGEVCHAEGGEIVVQSRPEYAPPRSERKEPWFLRGTVLFSGQGAFSSPCQGFVVPSLSVTLIDSCARGCTLAVQRAPGHRGTARPRRPWLPLAKLSRPFPVNGRWEATAPTRLERCPSIRYADVVGLPAGAAVPAVQRMTGGSFLLVGPPGPRGWLCSSPVSRRKTEGARVSSQGFPRHAREPLAAGRRPAGCPNSTP